MRWGRFWHSASPWGKRGTVARVPSRRAPRGPALSYTRVRSPSHPCSQRTRLQISELITLLDAIGVTLPRASSPNRVGLAGWVAARRVSSSRCKLQFRQSSVGLVGVTKESSGPPAPSRDPQHSADSTPNRKCRRCCIREGIRALSRPTSCSRNRDKCISRRSFVFSRAFLFFSHGKGRSYP